jgi:hypothetical protein
MDIANIERRLKKINTVLEIFKEDNRISPIEKDLLLGYVRELYDIIRDSHVDVVGHPKAIEQPKQEVIREEAVREVPNVPIPEVIRIPTIVPVSPKVEEIKQSDPIAIPEPPKIVDEVKPIVEVKHAPVNKLSADVEGLFRMEEISDLSDKLSMSKIEDINKVIGINERIFIVSELFGGNNALFTSTVTRLNACKSFEEAKEIIINELVFPLEWEKDDRLKKATQFVKHVRRRFN